MLTVVGDRPAGQKARSGLTESTPVGGVRQLPRSPVHPRQHSSNQFGRIARRTSPRNDARVRQSDDDHSAAALEGPSRPSSQILLDMFVDLTSSAQSPAKRRGRDCRSRPAAARLRLVANRFVQRVDMRPLDRRRREVAELWQDVQVHEPLVGEAFGHLLGIGAPNSVVRWKQSRAGSEDQEETLRSKN